MLNSPVDPSEILHKEARRRETELFTVRDAVLKLVEDGVLSEAAAALLVQGVDLMLVHEGINPPDSGYSDERLFGEEP